MALYIFKHQHLLKVARVIQYTCELKYRGRLLKHNSRKQIWSHLNIYIDLPIKHPKKWNIREINDFNWGPDVN